jgi:hypothetical protein
MSIPNLVGIPISGNEQFNWSNFFLLFSLNWNFFA